MAAGDHAPAIPSRILPRPLQYSHSAPAIFPLPLHFGQIFSPTPAGPSSSASPGAGSFEPEDVMACFLQCGDMEPSEAKRLRAPQVQTERKVKLNSAAAQDY